MMIAENPMPKMSKQILFWTPRILGILFTLFVGMFSLDVFEMGGGIWAILGGFLMHNLATIVMIVALVLGWRREWAGAIGFFAAGLWFLRMANAGDWGFVLVFVGIPVLVAVLFLVGWIYRKQIRVK
jgi:hypothetical protein